MILAGDIGGTKTVLSLYENGSDVHGAIRTETFPSRDFQSLEAVIEAFIGEETLTIHTAVFGVAGPVIDGKAIITNLTWVIEEEAIREKFSIERVKLINDLVAIANSIPILRPVDLFEIKSGDPVDRAPVAIIAPGTGLGESYLTWDGERYHAHPSEGGHTSYAPSDRFQLGLLNYLYDRFGHVSTERVASGSGIPNIYDYLLHIDYAPEPKWLIEKLAAAADRTPIIINTALDDPEASALCTKTLNLFVNILGAESGNLALQYMSRGGVYLSGGIPPRILGALDSEAFRSSFCHKGRFKEMMKSIPVKVIMNPRAALLGAARVSLELAAA